MKINGNIEIINAADAKKYAGVTEVNGNLYISSDVNLDALTSVGGHLSISSDVKLDAPQLTSVGGNLSIYSDVNLDALTSVGGHLYIYSDVNLDALTSVGGHLSIYSDVKLDAPRLYSRGFENFKVYDGIGCVVLSTKTRNGIDILSCRHSKIKNNELVGDKFYVAKQGEFTAHATTIKEALDELAFKAGSRDVEQYRNMSAKTRKKPQQWAMIYRQITGACKFGTDDFMARKALKKTYTLTEIIAETKGAYGHDQFVSVVQ